MAGDLSRKHKASCEKAGGIPYDIAIINKVVSACLRNNVSILVSV